MREKLRRFWAVFLCLCMLSGVNAWAADMNSLLQQGNEYAAAGDYERALASYELAAMVDPAHHAPKLSIISLYMDHEKWDAAYLMLEELLASDPVNAEVWAAQSRMCIASGDIEGAEKALIYAEVLGANEEALLPAQLDMAACWVKLEEYEKAMAIYDQVDILTLLGEDREYYAWAQWMLEEAAKELKDPYAEAEQLALVEEAWFSGELEGYEIGMPVSVYAQYQEDFSDFPLSRTSEDGRTVYIAAPTEAMEEFQEWSPVGISPDGKTILLTDGYWFYAWMGEKTIMVLSPVYDRGAEDIYGAFSKAAEKNDWAKVGEDGVVWSPDGRYAVTGQYFQGLQKGMYLDLILMDVWTGEVFPLTAFPKKATQGPSTVIHVRFDKSGRYLYYGLYGRAYENRCSLVRYDLETQEHTLCYNGSELIAYPGLWELPDGSFISLMDSVQKDHCVGLNHYYMQGNGIWRNDAQYFAASMAQIRGRKLEYSMDSGYALVKAYHQQGLIRIDTEDQFAGMDTMWAIDSLSSTAAVALEMRELPSDDAELTRMLSPYASVYGLSLSPDGNYALLYAVHQGESAYLLLDVRDMSIRQVEAPAELLEEKTAFSWNVDFLPGISWQADGRILVIGDGVGVYRLQEAQ